MEECNNKKGLVKRGVAVDQLHTLADIFWQDTDPQKAERYEKYYGFGIDVVAGFAAGLNYAGCMIDSAWEPTPAHIGIAIEYMRNQLEEPDEETDEEPDMMFVPASKAKFIDWMSRCVDPEEE